MVEHNYAEQHQQNSPELGGRKRGGQPGNQNARTHGFYSKAVPPELQQKLQDAETVKGLDQEIALLRSKIAIAAENSGDYRELVPGISLLSKLLSTRKKLGDEENEKLTSAIAQAWSMLLPPGIVDPLQASRILSEYMASGAKLPPPTDAPKTFAKPPTNQIEWPGTSEPEVQRKNNQPPPGLA